MKFEARISKMGTRYIINIPSALHPQIRDLGINHSKFAIVIGDKVKT